MAGIALDLEVDGASRLARLMQRLHSAGGTRGLSDALDDIGLGLVGAAQATIESERSPTGKSWPPLAAATRPRRRSDAKMLQDTRCLYRSLTHAVRGKTLAVGTNVIYARIHQQGGKVGRGRKVVIPARTYLGWGPRQRAVVRRGIVQHLREALHA